MDFGEKEVCQIIMIMIAINDDGDDCDDDRRYDDDDAGGNDYDDNNDDNHVHDYDGQNQKGNAELTIPLCARN